MYPIETFLVGCSQHTLPDLHRELANLSVTVGKEYARVRDCLAHWVPSPSKKRLFIVEPKTADDVQQIERLNEAFIGEPIIALVDPRDDSTLLLRAMRAGAAQVVRLPLEPDDFATAMERIAVQFGHPVNQCKVIAVTGANAGVGATSVAINLAAEIAQQQRVPCVLTEASFQFGKLATHLDIEPEFTWYNLLRDPDRLDADLVRQALSRMTEHFHVLAGAHKAITPVSVDSHDVLRVLSYLRQTAEVIVIDMPYALDATYFEILANAHDIVLLGEQTVPSIHDMKILLETLKKDDSQFLARQFAAINRYDPSDTEITLESVRDILNLPEMIAIAKDTAAFHDAENTGKVLRKTAPRSAALKDIQQLAERIMDRGETQPSHSDESTNMLSRMAHALHLTTH